MNAPERAQSPGEEIANSVSHGAGLAWALATAPLLIAHAVRRGGAAGIIGASVFAAAVASLYLTSTLYHALPRGGAKRLCRVVEHGAIFLLIAGTYTPFTLGVLRGPLGWTFLALIWALAAAGIGLKVIVGAQGRPVLSTLLYLFMGWISLAAIRPLWSRMPLPGIALLALGGAAYTAGVPFYSASRLRYGHFVWHLFVIAGTVFHFFAVLWYAV